MKRARPQARKPHPARPGAERSALLRIEKAIYGGAFLARPEGKATFVPLTLPGELVRARLLDQKRSYSTAEPEVILESAPGRIQPPCQHFGTCGGCSYQHADYETQLRIKEGILRETLERGGIAPPEKIGLLRGQPWQYRNRIRLAVDGAVRLGYRGRRSHDVIAVRECPIAAPLLVSAALAADQILAGPKAVFQPGEISLFSNADESALLAGVLQSGSSSRGFEAFAREWKERVPAIRGIELAGEAQTGQPPSRIGLAGDESIEYRAAGRVYRVDHGAFFQVNRWLIDDLVGAVVGERRGRLAWDLFAGVGLFARQLAERFDEVLAVESAPAAAAALAANLHGTGAKSVLADARSFLGRRAERARPDLVVVDPPRTGLGPELTSPLADLGAPELVYVSCDPATLTRDLKALTASGYSLGSVLLADLFPQTFHLETVVTLRR